MSDAVSLHRKESKSMKLAMLASGLGGNVTLSSLLSFCFMDIFFRGEFCSFLIFYHSTGKDEQNLVFFPLITSLIESTINDAESKFI